MARPVRVQVRRTKGWRMPPNTVYVGRPSKWGNPYRFGPELSRAEAVALYGAYLLEEAQGLWRQLGELRGKNLACWCPLDEPCHADLLLRLANPPRRKRKRPPRPRAGSRAKA